MNRLLSFDEHLKNRRFTLSEIASDRELVSKTTLTHLKSLMYHNLPKVDVLYRHILGVDIFGLLGEKNKKTLGKPVVICAPDKDRWYLQFQTEETARNGEPYIGSPTLPGRSSRTRTRA